MDLSNVKTTRNETFAAKIIAMAALLIATMFCGSLPYLLNNYFKWTAQKPNSHSSIFLNFMLQLSGGVLLATTFLHLLPEVYEVIDHLNICNELPKLPFALPETLMCFGFFLIYLIESLIDLYITKRAKKVLEKLKKITINSGELVNIEEAIRTCDTCQQKQNEHLNTSRSFNGLLIVFALSLHEVFEGMAIGLENHNSSVWLMFAAVSAHKLILAFCLGVEIMIVRTPNLLAFFYLLLFAIITPIGIVIGILLSHNGIVTRTSLTVAILQGLACGTLLYVVFFEILKGHRTNLSSLLAIFIGFVIMFGLQMFDTVGNGQNIC